MRQLSGVKYWKREIVEHRIKSTQGRPHGVPLNRTIVTRRHKTRPKFRDTEVGYLSTYPYLPIMNGYERLRRTAIEKSKCGNADNLAACVQR